MSFNITPLLLHSEAVPAQAKAALIAASQLDEGSDQRALLETAARALYDTTPLACSEARELVGLPPGICT